MRVVVCFSEDSGYFTTKKRVLGYAASIIPDYDHVTVQLGSFPCQQNELQAWLGSDTANRRRGLVSATPGLGMATPAAMSFSGASFSTAGRLVDELRNVPGVLCATTVGIAETSLLYQLNELPTRYRLLLGGIRILHIAPDFTHSAGFT